MTIEIPAHLKTLIEEANTNFQSSRFIDAANTFARITDACKQEKMPEDATYFSYRAALAYKKGDNQGMRIRQLTDLAIYLLQQSIEPLNSLIESSADTDRLRYLKRMEKILGYLSVDDQREIVIRTIINHLNLLIKEGDLDEQHEYLIELFNYESYLDPIEPYVQKQIEIYRQLADRYEYTGAPDTEEGRMLKVEEEKTIREHYMKKAEQFAAKYGIKIKKEERDLLSQIGD
ncbi:MAG: hypothetical protein INQ03_09150 [Candidatus Heimdallarchaeota archaeon]|nr:hypothetical protein [Candidatus Heimdallarchaeota archaeon]